jgi:hypothetical protein
VDAVDHRSAGWDVCRVRVRVARRGRCLCYFFFFFASKMLRKKAVMAAWVRRETSRCGGEGRAASKVNSNSAVQLTGREMPALVR